MRSALVVVALALASCFNPDLGDGLVACGVGGACPLGYACDAGKQRCFKMPSAGDMASIGDMAGGDGGGTLDMTGGCGSDGTRVCIDQTHSGVCMNNVAVPDRSCPPGSTCTTGHCKPPTGAMACTSSKQCGMNVCIEYNVNGALAGFCTAPIANATGGAGASCSTAGYDNTCKTGVCAEDVATSTTRDCLYPCMSPGDCGGGLSCGAVVGAPSSIEGAPVGALKFCS